MSPAHTIYVYAHVRATRAMKCYTLHVSSTSPSQSASLQSLRSIIVRLHISKSTSTISFLCDDRARTFAASEATASRCAISVRCACSSDELCASSCASRIVSTSVSSSRRRSPLRRCYWYWRSWLCSGICVSCSASCDSSCSIVVRLCVSESASSITLLCNYWT